MTASGVRVVGLDGCRDGWVAASAEVVPAGLGALSLRRIDRLEDALELRPAIIAADVPIGLPTRAEPGGRSCDRAARKALGPRKASVFSPPVEGVLACETYEQALEAMRSSSEHAIGLSKQSWNIVPKIREAHAFSVIADREGVAFVESHPELIFAEMAGTPMAEGKKSAGGRAARLAALKAAGLVCDLALAGAQQDDVIDALACLWTAGRIARDEAHAYGDPEGPRIWA